MKQICKFVFFPHIQPVMQQNLFSARTVFMIKCNFSSPHFSNWCRRCAVLPLYMKKKIIIFVFLVRFLHHEQLCNSSKLQVERPLLVAGYVNSLSTSCRSPCKVLCFSFYGPNVRKCLSLQRLRVTPKSRGFCDKGRTENYAALIRYRTLQR